MGGSPGVGGVPLYGLRVLADPDGSPVNHAQLCELYDRIATTPLHGAQAARCSGQPVYTTSHATCAWGLHFASNPPYCGPSPTAQGAALVVLAAFVVLATLALGLRMGGARPW